MTDAEQIARAADLFKALGSASRLQLVHLLSAGAKDVSTLVAETGMSQPLVSQHLKTLRSAGIVVASRTGREVSYAIADHHIAHIVEDTARHVQEHREDPI